MAARMTYLPAIDSTVHVWVAQVPDNSSSHVEELLAPLPQHLADRILLFQHSQDRWLRLGALTLMAHGLHCLAGLDYAASYAALQYNDHGRPVLASAALQKNWQVSFSYAFPWVACALRFEQSAPVASPPSTPCTAGLGIDMELAESTSPLYLGPTEGFAHVFSPAERAVIAQSVDSGIARVQRWTIKEALLKVLGAGFGLDPLSIDTCKPSDAASVPTSLHRGTQCSTTQQKVYSLYYDQCQLFWQSHPLAQGWLTIAAQSPWQHTEISFLRLAQKGHTLLLL